MPASVDDDFWVAGSSTRARRKSQAYGEPLWGDAPKWEGPCELVVEPPIKSRYFESFLATFFASVEAATLLVDDVDLTLTPAREGKARRLRLDMRSNLAAADDGVAVTGVALDPTRGLPLSRRHVKWKLRIVDAAARSACAAELERGLENARQRARYEFSHPPLGKGAGGTVWRATDRFNGSEVAVKIVSATSVRRRRGAVREAMLMLEMTRAVETDHVVRILSVVDQPTYEVSGAIFFVMELCSGGDLFERVAARRRFGERDAARAARDVVAGLEALHGRGILHLDIKPENILYSSRGDDAVLKITDFGMSRYVDDHPNATRARARNSTAGPAGPRQTSRAPSHRCRFGRFLDASSALVELSARSTAEVLVSKHSNTRTLKSGGRFDCQARAGRGRPRHAAAAGHRGLRRAGDRRRDAREAAAAVHVRLRRLRSGRRALRVARRLRALFRRRRRRLPPEDPARVLHDAARGLEARVARRRRRRHGAPRDGPDGPAFGRGPQCPRPPKVGA